MYPEHPCCKVNSNPENHFLSLYWKSVAPESRPTFTGRMWVLALLRFAVRFAPSSVAILLQIDPRYQEKAHPSCRRFCRTENNETVSNLYAKNGRNHPCSDTHKLFCASPLPFSPHSLCSSSQTTEIIYDKRFISHRFLLPVAADLSVVHFIINIAKYTLAHTLAFTLNGRDRGGAGR